ncbi:MAG: relaxase/mobilization nuclease domain-containing protein [Defluviicoccus sp.]|nr:relaxase/mobilization nuclease domain-containing protein [Defluviicoccus sp.]
MVAKVHAAGRSFAGVARYCLHDAPEPDEGDRPPSADRVAWAETRNLTSRPERAAAQMAATANSAPELKRLAGVSSAGRKLEKPVVHYTLAWAKDERPDRAEMTRAADQTLKALGLERHQALIVAHRDTAHPHLHVIANRVDPQTGRAANLRGDHFTLSRWAEQYERERGEVKCPERAANNAERRDGAFVRDRKSLHTGRYRRERMGQPDVQWRQAPPVPLKTPEFRQRWADRAQAGRDDYQARRERDERYKRADWSQRFARQRSDREAVKTLAGGGVADRLRLARIAEEGDWRRLRQTPDGERRGGGLAGKMRGAWKEIRSMGVRGAVTAVRTDPAAVERRALQKLDRAHRLERARLARSHSRSEIIAEGELPRDQAYQRHMDEADREARQSAALERQWDLEAQRQQMPRQMPERGPTRDRGGGWER